MSKFNDLYTQLNPSNDDLQLLDLRSFEQANSTGLIKQSILLPLNLPFEWFIGSIISPMSNLMIIVNNEDRESALTRMKKIKFNPIGAYNFDEIKQPKYNIRNFNSTTEVENLIDVREQSEWDQGVVDFDKSFYIKMNWLNYKWRELDTNKNYAVLCRGGVRSMIAASYLYSKGIKADNITGGIISLVKGGIKLKKKH